MSGFTKLHSSIIHSTIWREPNHIRVTWVTMMALADQDGVINASIPGLADAARVTIPELKEALALFQEPDPYSRTPDYDGRRIETIRGGWRLLNYDMYRELKSHEDVKEKARIRKQRQRDRQQPDVTHVTRDVTPGHACHDIAEAEAEVEVEAKTSTTPVSRKRATAPKHDQTLEEILGGGEGTPIFDAYWKLVATFGGQAKNPAPKTTVKLYAIATGREGLSPEQIQAKADALRRGTSEVRFMPQLAKWLEGHGYMTPDLVVDVGGSNGKQHHRSRIDEIGRRQLAERNARRAAETANVCATELDPELRDMF